MTVNTRTNPSLRVKLRLLVNRQVLKMTTRRNNTRKTTKMFVQLGVSQIVVLEQAVLPPLLEVKWVKLTMLYGTTSVLILLDIQVFWHWIMFPDWVPSVSTWIVLYAFLYTGSYRPIRIFHMLSVTNLCVWIRITCLSYVLIRLFDFISICWYTIFYSSF